MRPERIWYVVINSNRARILSGLSKQGEPAGEEVAIQGARHKLRELLSERPARTYACSGGGRRAAVEPGSDPLRADTLEFIRKVFRYLEAQRKTGALEGLIVIGSPDIVGLWRQEIPASLDALVRREVIKNLVRLPAPELAPSIRDLLAAS